MNGKHSDEKNRHTIGMRSATLTGIFVLGILYSIYVARDVLLPIFLALLLTLLLRPVVRLLKKIKIPELISAALVLLCLLAALGVGIANLSDPAQEWINKAPQTFHNLVQKFKDFAKPIQTAQRTAEELKKLAGTDQSKKELAVRPGPSLAESFLSGVQGFLAKGATMLILMFFLLASGDLFVQKLMRLFPAFSERKQMTEIIRDIEHSVSRYLLTVTLINLTEGVLVGIAMYLIGMPDPVLWGVMAGLLIYIPYLGPLVGISVVAIVAVVTLDNIQIALLAPVVYLSIEIVQGQFVTPMVLGARFSMNPVVIFIWLMFWGWLWGIVGALIAVPLLTVFKILCDQIEPLHPVGDFLSS